MEALESFHQCGDGQHHVFETIAANLIEKGYSITPGGLPQGLCQALLDHTSELPGDEFDPAGIGRDRGQTLNPFVRTDEICWITGEGPATAQWLQWAQSLQVFLNRRLYLGLFSFESHFAHYGPGDFYKRHYDAFRGEANRILSLVVYLNPAWSLDDGGELVVYRSDTDQRGVKVTPALGTVVVFLSEQFPHEVLPSFRDRYSIAGWFRVNTSICNRIDPPT